LPLLVASITGPLVDGMTHVVNDVGLVGIALMMTTTGIVGLPGSEPTMLFAGFNVYQHHHTLVQIFVAGVIGDLLGASIAYAIGRWGATEIATHGHKVHLSQARLDRAHRWSERFGAPAVFVSRLIPGIRFAFPYAAGIAKMSYAKFISFAALGSTIWVVAFGVVGRQVGADWQTWRKHLEIVDYVVLALVVAGIAYLVVRRMRSGRRAAVDAVSK
jgi:membrane protein DedA with SNARE-associated domain